MCCWIFFVLIIHKLRIAWSIKPLGITPQHQQEKRDEEKEEKDIEREQDEGVVKVCFLLLYSHHYGRIAFQIPA